MTDTVIEARDELADVTDVIAQCAANVRRKFGHWVEYEDLVQEAWLWVLEHRHDVDEWLSAGRAGLVSFRITRHLLRYARKERADRTGYSGEDQFYYSLRALRRMLPLVLTSDGTPPGAGDSVTRAPGGARSSGEWEAAYADIRRAYAELDDGDQGLLWSVYVAEVPTRSLAILYGLTTDALTAKVRRCMERLQSKLGGPAPGD